MSSNSKFREKNDCKKMRRNINNNKMPPFSSSWFGLFFLLSSSFHSFIHSFSLILNAFFFYHQWLINLRFSSCCAPMLYLLCTYIRCIAALWMRMRRSNECKMIWCLWWLPLFVKISVKFPSNRNIEFLIHIFICLMVYKSDGWVVAANRFRSFFCCHRRVQ